MKKENGSVGIQTKFKLIVVMENLFGGKQGEAQNALYTVIKNRGYEYFEKTPKTTMTVNLVDDLKALGFEIKQKL